MRNTKADRRSLRSRQLLSDALIALMMEKTYASITVQDIINRANIGRSTFYAHYLDKDDVLSSQFEKLIEELSQNAGHKHGEGNSIMPSLSLFHHVQQHYPLYKALVIWGSDLNFVSQTIRSFLSSSIEKQLDVLLFDKRDSLPPFLLISNYLADAFLSLLKWWLDNSMVYSPERMDELFQQLVMPGVQAALGLEL